jgi:hypothetical protein
MQINIWAKLYYLNRKVENIFLSKKQKETVLLVLL